MPVPRPIELNFITLVQKQFFFGQHLGDHHLSKGSHNTFPLCKGGLIEKEMKTRPDFLVSWHRLKF
jgi:hypothetical protein